MNVVSRGIRNAFRNSIRTFSIIVILGLSVGLALTMLVARQAVTDKIASVKSSIGNTITITPAGSMGFQGGGEPLTSDQLKQVSQLSNVTNVTQTLSDRLTTENSSLTSAVEAGSLGRRQAGNSGVGFQAMQQPPEGMGQSQRTSEGNTGQNSSGGTTQITRTFTPPVTITGANNVTDKSVFGGSTAKITSGQAIDPSKDVDQAMVGTSLATKNNLKVGSTFTAYSKTITVVGIYDTGNTFENAGLVMSLPALQRLSSQTGDVTNAVVTVNSVDNIDDVTTAAKKVLGDKADVTNSQDSAKQAITPLENVKSISLFSLIGALVAGATIILLTMTMIVRERRREIGVMKAIGASNLKTVFQFVSEAVTLTVLALVVGLVIGVVAANPVTKTLVSNSTNSTSDTATTAGNQNAGSDQARGFGGSGERPEAGAGRDGLRGLRNIGGQSLTSARNIQASVGWSILGYGIGAAIVIAIIGSALPAFLISKIRPAEVMRAE